MNCANADPLAKSTSAPLGSLVYMTWNLSGGLRRRYSITTLDKRVAPSELIKSFRCCAAANRGRLSPWLLVRSTETNSKPIQTREPVESAVTDQVLHCCYCASPSYCGLTTETTHARRGSLPLTPYANRNNRRSQGTTLAISLSTAWLPFCM